ncbi:DUF6265 family protein [Sphingomonas sp.]|jgi:hypothetical protein|uniref:DUF6265 family protein n=1 Tax=Sphingomonas sp. TaxID=28214 RepID=UPI002EDA7C81
MIAAFALLLAPEPEPDLSWLIGEWCTETSKVTTDRQTCETWSPMVKGVMQGRTRVRHERFFTVEPMRMTVEPGRLVFHSKPPKQKAADFYAVGAQPAMSIRFENRTHDYPQVVRYWREGELLMAEISLADGSKPSRWTYRRKK